MIKEGRIATELLSLFRVLTHLFPLHFVPSLPLLITYIKSSEIDIPSKKIFMDAEKAAILRPNVNAIAV